MGEGIGGRKPVLAVCVEAGGGGGEQWMEKGSGEGEHFLYGDGISASEGDVCFFDNGCDVYVCIYV